MATINCNGDCLGCAHRLNGETNPSECASMYSFIHIQQSMRDMRVMHSDIMTAIKSLTSTEEVVVEPKEFVCNSELLASEETATETSLI